MAMKGQRTCPRCARPVQEPNLWSSSWLCDEHGPVHPVQPVVQPTSANVAALATSARVPVWCPWPLPHGWVVTGMACAGDERTGARATAVACSGPAPLGGMGELVLVAEEPGIGLGARYAGLSEPDPGDGALGGAPSARVEAAGHPAPLWWIDGRDDRAVYVGEAMGVWLWMVLWPDSAGLLVLEDLILTDLRDVAGEIAMLPLGALSPRLAGAEV